jgi:hypothetical protein
MIKSFRCKETQKIFSRRFSRKLPQDIQGRDAPDQLPAEKKEENGKTGRKVAEGLS